MTTLMDGHVVEDDDGVARLEGTRVTVMDLVLAKQANGWTPEQLHEQYPHLSLAGIYAAFAYYHDRRAAIDAQIANIARLSDQARSSAGDPPPFIKRLRDTGRRS